MAVLAIYLWVYGTTRLSAVAVGVALASIPLVRLWNKSMMVTDKAIDIAKVSNKNTDRVTKYIESLIEIAGKKDDVRVGYISNTA